MARQAFFTLQLPYLDLRPFQTDGPPVVEYPKWPSPPKRHFVRRFGGVRDRRSATRHGQSVLEQALRPSEQSYVDARRRLSGRSVQPIADVPGLTVDARFLRVFKDSGAAVRFELGWAVTDRHEWLTSDGRALALVDAMLTRPLVYPRDGRRGAAQSTPLTLVQFAAKLRRTYYTATQEHRKGGPSDFESSRLVPLDASAMLILPRLDSLPGTASEPFAFQMSSMPNTPVGTLPNLICVAPRSVDNDPLLRRFRTEYMRFACELQALDALAHRFGQTDLSSDSDGGDGFRLGYLANYFEKSLDRIIGSLSQIDLGAPGWPLRLSEALTRQGLTDPERLTRLKMAMGALIKANMLGRGLAERATRGISAMTFNLSEGATLQIGGTVNHNDIRHNKGTIIQGNSGPVNTGDRAVVGQNQSNIYTGDGNAIQFGEYSADDVTADLETLSKQLENEVETAKEAGNDTEAENSALKKTLLEALQAKVKEAVEAVNPKAVFDAVKSAGTWILEKAEEYKLPALLFVVRKAFALP